MIVFQESLRVINPLFIAGLLRFFEKKTPLSEAYLYATGIFVVSLLLTFTHHAYFFSLQRIGFHIRAGTCGLMYKKVIEMHFGGFAL